mmetsp:Transcript_17043/g.23849  ORF Transcript_17043/g.23849 Transcript_17043/m.23849 type:complete len:399 (-) Transcript_17043:147-1343(-)|eukprot:CAMPEP_0184491302 /NCGR_PEP_ID=MMETSP0113_2-20130426/20090_1 /TAXON_ID=91329 /ORGANISM="Norrisiella sphaerica, Strain BC52" /LENGTH=398 /DNA_ID=CAMNT_0026875611 /DNA_START=81 /DNA_END=1277 /DNA_ORIENTATION=-
MAEDEKVVMEEDAVEESEEPQDPLLVLAEHRYAMQAPLFSADEKKEAKEKLMKLIKESDMTPYYKYICDLMGWEKDESLAKKMEEANVKKVKELETALEDAKKNRGETEVRDAEVAIAKHYGIIGDKKVAMEKLEEVLESTVGTGQKIDLVFVIIRLAMSFNDIQVVKKYVTMAKDLVEKGGDWERRNLLKVYEATYLVRIRDFKEASELFIDSVATFTCTAIYSYETMVFYTVITAMISLDRISLRQKIVRSPEILQVVQDMPAAQTLIQSLYKCKYAELFKVLVEISTMMKKDRYLAPHCGWWLREMRIVAYSQFLCSYRSVTLSSMATTFGVSIEFLDKELARFIAAGRLNCKVDAVNLVIETNRPDAKNSQYSEIITKGDHLLSRIQKLSIELT